MISFCIHHIGGLSFTNGSRKFILVISYIKVKLAFQVLENQNTEWCEESLD